MKKKRVIVAMSGGIDSSVATALLKRAGFHIEGVFMKLVDIPRFKEGEKMAKKVAKVLQIPFLVLDLKREFKKKIIDYFLKEYKEGRTPNPCVVCNREMKFDLLLQKTPKLKADFVATGHYACLRRQARLKIKEASPLSFYKLYKGKDKEKDQSYFLWQLRQPQMRRILFPVGQYTKKEVRLLAKEFKLPVLNFSESQEICFVPRETNSFLRKYLKTKPGPIKDPKGNPLGKHQGLWFYTIGQRKGIGLSGGPYYVLGKDTKKNLLIVTKNEKDLLKKELIVKKVNWISGKEPKFPLKVKAKIRYRHKEASGKIYKIKNSKYKILFNSSQRAITPGQSAVFYKSEELVGGGIIC